MAETKLERYRRLITEAKAIEPKPAIPIKDVLVDPGEEGGVTITRNGEGDELDIRELRIEAKKGLVYPAVTLTDAQMDAVCAFWAKAKELAKP